MKAEAHWSEGKITVVGLRRGRSRSGRPSSETGYLLEDSSQITDWLKKKEKNRSQEVTRNSVTTFTKQPKELHTADVLQERDLNRLILKRTLSDRLSSQRKSRLRRPVIVRVH
ncbi:hypothetical protein CEXT_56721 [Caerostris extrusa]|uniref:Uncharacterized protein n=1 Tax=Caerostris extrusa TaxID=172846 RepID=A0AAV4TRY8_CAEEX|nr:hypothetical protein CEXT_56721 [Caerostris extrusa]